MQVFSCCKPQKQFYCHKLYRFLHGRPCATKWKSVVGLEIHAQILSSSKLFSGAGTRFASPVNTCVSLFDAAVPGTLPVLNRRCVEAGVLTALALLCQINPVSLFDRKHYFYSDLPAGYQITQQRVPLAKEGKLQFQVYTPGIHRQPYTKISHIHQIQLEQDSGKSLHDEMSERSLVDLNRAGIPLIELVFEPDLTDGEEAAALVKELMIILQRLGTCSCKMEEGALRVDANVSIHQENEPLGTRTEVKNIGSVRAVAHAIEYEIKRQMKILEGGGIIANETRSWDAQSKQTIPMRDKEEKQDYRFMPEPNLPPLHLLVDFGSDLPHKDKVNVNFLKKSLPELPEATRQKLCSKYGVSSESAISLVNEDLLLQNFFEIMSEKGERDPKLVANILLIEVLTLLHKHKMVLSDWKVKASETGEVVDLLQSKTVNLMTAKKLLEEKMNGNSSSPLEIVTKKGWIQISDPEEIAKLCNTVLSQNEKLVNQYRNGKTKVFNALVGEVSKSTQKRANMELVVEELKRQLNKDA